MPAIIDGTVDKVITSKPNYIRCIVRGKVDPQALPALNDESVMMIFTSLNKKPLDIRAGSEIYANAKIRPPAKAQLQEDFPESDYFKAIDVKWFARASSKNAAVTGQSDNIKYKVAGFAEEIRKINRELYPNRIAGIANALTTGNKSGIDYSAREQFSRAGTAHLLAVSGLHTGIIAVFAFLVIRPLRIRWLRITIFALILAAFVVVTGMQPSAVRAALMAAAYYIANELQRKTEALNVLSFAVILMIVFDPGLVYSAGFRMSAAAILGIAVLFRPFHNFWLRLLPDESKTASYISTSLAATFSASVVVSPLVAYYFGIFSLVSPLTNLIVVPMMSGGMIFSLFALVFYPLSGFIAEIYSSAAEVCIRASMAINDLAIDLPAAYLEGGNLVWISLILSAGIIYILTSQNAGQSIFRFSISIILAGLAIYQLPDNKEGISIYPRRDYVAVIVEHRDTTYAALFDRKPEAYPIRDPAMEEHLAGSKFLIIGTSGNASISISDAIKRKKEVIIIPLSIDDFHQFKGLLSLDKHIPQIIDYDYEYDRNY
jgi:competence protein ComEC